MKQEKKTKIEHKNREKFAQVVALHCIRIPTIMIKICNQSKILICIYGENIEIAFFQNALCLMSVP